MSEIIERVARAIAEAGNGGVWTDENWYKEYQRDVHRVRARSAIEAMREPTEMMKRRGAMCMPDYDPSIDDAEQCWQTMLDAGLNEKVPA